VRTRDHARSDFPIRQGRSSRSILWVQKSPDKGFEEQFSSSGLGKRRSWWERTCPGWRVCVRVVSERENLFVFCSREERKISPCRQGEKDNHPIQRIGETREEEEDKHKSRNGKADT
jgi:hypothetical protein